MRRLRLLATATLLLGGLAGCGDDPGGPTGDPTPARADGATTPSDEPTPTDQPSPSKSEATGAFVPPSWRPVPGPASTTVTVGGDWTLTQRRTSAVLDGPEPMTVRAPADHRISHALLDEEYAVVVAEDELAERPDTATVVDLATGERTVVDGDSHPPTTVGGTWALGDGQLLHATVDRGAYCLAEVDLASGEGRTRWCAPERHGFSDARITPAGTSVLTFDDARPSCRTVVTLVDDGVEPFAGVPDCTGWDGLVVDDATVWSVVPKARRVEEATFHATTPDGTVDLGPGTSGTLTWCGGAAWSVRDPQKSADPARLVRWTPTDGAAVAYETAARGRAFLAEPRCAGDALTITAFTEEGDEQVSAPLETEP